MRGVPLSFYALLFCSRLPRSPGSDSPPHLPSQQPEVTEGPHPHSFCRIWPSPTYPGPYVALRGSLTLARDEEKQEPEGHGPQTQARPVRLHRPTGVKLEFKRGW